MTDNTNIYPWHESVWQRVSKQNKRLPHALLLHGRQGTGKLDFAHFLSKSLLCERPVNQQACHECAKCLWFAEGHHPDFKVITPEDADSSEDAPKKKATKKTQIAVSQIRQLIQTLSLSNHETGGLRVALIYPAETMNSASANALLKVLEEPPNNTIFILVCNQIKRLLPTIISRCQAIAMPLPEKNAALGWLASQQVEQAEALLAYYGGAPLTALELKDISLNPQLFKHLSMGAKMDAMAGSALLATYGMEQAITILQKWLYDVLLCHYAQQQYYHLHYSSALQALTKSVNLSRLLDFQNTLLQAKVTANHPLSLELQLENVLLQYKKVFVH
jgi:DNA polymerase III subunit delta'